MKNFILILASFFALLSTQGQSLTVNNTTPNNNPYWLASNVLVDPNFIIFQPIDPNTGLPIPQPNTNQVGIFNAAGTAFPIDSGIVMCCNAVQDVLPGQNGANPNTGPFVDPELTAVLTSLKPVGNPVQAIYDRVQIIFSFVATSDSIEFNFVFGSHEYASYTCSNYNDVFGFFLTGPGINGNASNSTANLAVIPGTNVPVAVNTINSGSGGTPSWCLAANPNYVAHSAMFNTGIPALSSLSGFTDKFTATAQVTCGNVYTIRLVLANAADHILSSAVFLEAKSFKSPSIEISTNLNNGNSFNDSTVVEGCKPSYVKFKKDGNVSVGMGINLAFSGTAVNGVDLVQIPDSIWIPPGQAADSLLIQAIDDGIAEGFEDFKIVMQPVTTSCYVYPPKQIDVILRDKEPVVATTNAYASSDTIYCPNDTASIYGNVTGGEGNTYGGWVDDPTAPNRRLVQPTQTTTYRYWALDECGNDTVFDEVTIYLANYTPMSYEVDSVVVCRGDTAFFFITVSDGRPPYVFNWANGNTGPSYWVVPSSPTTYYPFTITDACGQSVTDSAQAKVAPDPVSSFSYLNDYNVPLRVSFTNRSVNMQTWFWDFGDGTTSNDRDPIHDYDRPGTYYVTLKIVSAEGCESEITLEVVVETDFYIYVPNAFTPDGDGLNECFEIKGVGFDSFEIKIFDRWGNQVFFSDNVEQCWDGSINGQLAPQGVYTYTIFLRLPFDKIYQKQGAVTVYR
jgi:gliding motility-associated-like protein